VCHECAWPEELSELDAIIRALEIAGKL